MNNTESNFIDTLWDTLDLPRSCYLGSRITKKVLLENNSLKAGDRKLITEDIERLQWEYTLKPETINIAAFQSDDLDYGEIAILQAELRNPKRARRLAEVLQRLIPYPLVLVLIYEDQVRMSLALKRQNLADQQKLTVESFFDTGWLAIDDENFQATTFYQSLDSKQFNWESYYTFYLSWLERIVTFQSGQITGQFQLGQEPLSIDLLLLRQDKITEYWNLQKEMLALRKQAAKARQISKQIELNTRIRQLQQEASSLKQSLLNHVAK